MNRGRRPTAPVIQKTPAMSQPIPALPATRQSDLAWALRESTHIRMVLSRFAEGHPGTTTVRTGLLPYERPSPRWRFDAPDTAWRSFPADLPAVTAAIDSMSGAHDLQALDCPARACWWHSSHEPGRLVHITVHARGHEVVVGVHFQLAMDAPERDRNVQAVIFAGVAASIAGCLLFGELVGVMLLNVGLWLAFVTLAVVAPRWRRRRELSAWSRAWRHSFWAALAARLAAGRIYR